MYSGTQHMKHGGKDGGKDENRSLKYINFRHQEGSQTAQVQQRTHKKRQKSHNNNCTALRDGYRNPVLNYESPLF